MQRFIANAVAVTYVGFVAYVVTDPWHEQETKVSVVTTWGRGMFYIQAKVDMFLLT
jgi:hypothetical protein